MKILIKLEGGLVSGVLIQSDSNEWVKADNTLVGVLDKDSETFDGEPYWLTTPDAIFVDSIVDESAEDARPMLIESGF